MKYRNVPSAHWIRMTSVPSALSESSTMANQLQPTKIEIGYIGQRAMGQWVIGDGNDTDRLILHDYPLTLTTTGLRLTQRSNRLYAEHGRVTNRAIVDNTYVYVYSL